MRETQDYTSMRTRLTEVHAACAIDCIALFTTAYNFLTVVVTSSNKEKFYANKKTRDNVSLPKTHRAATENRIEKRNEMCMRLKRDENYLEIDADICLCLVCFGSRTQP